MAMNSCDRSTRSGRRQRRGSFTRRFHSMSAGVRRVAFQAQPDDDAGHRSAVAACPSARAESDPLLRLYRLITCSRSVSTPARHSSINSSGRSKSCMAQGYRHVLRPAGLPPNPISLTLRDARLAARPSSCAIRGLPPWCSQTGTNHGANGVFACIE